MKLIIQLKLRNQIQIDDFKEEYFDKILKQLNSKKQFIKIDVESGNHVVFNKDEMLRMQMDSA